MKTNNIYKFNKSKKGFPERHSLNININPINTYIPQTDRNIRKLSFLILTLRKNHEKTEKLSSYKHIQKRLLKKNTTPNIGYKKNKLNQRYLNENSHIKKDNKFLEKSKKLEKLDKIDDNKINKRFSVISGNNIKIKLNNISNINISSRNSSNLIFNRSNESNIFKDKRKAVKVISESKNGNKIEKSQNINPFEIDEEDKIFKKVIIYKKRKRKKMKLLFSRDNPLSKVYKKLPYIINEINKVKKLKNDMNLIQYQKTLMEVGSQVLDRDICNKLNKKFYDIRKSTEKTYHYFVGIIDTIEEKEKKIIRKINTQQNFFKKVMVNNNRANWIYGMNNKIDFFPEVKFYPTPKFLLYNEQKK